MIMNTGKCSMNGKGFSQCSRVTEKNLGDKEHSLTL
jgi:hypothetical protein